MVTRFLIPALCILSFNGIAREKTDLEAKDLKGKVADLTETTLTCPKFVAWGCILKTRPNPEYVTTHTIPILDANGRQTSCKFYNGFGRLIKQSYYSYTTNDFIKEITTRDPDGKPMSRIVYTFDARNYPIRIDYYNEHDSLYHPIDLAGTFFKDKNTSHFNETGEITEKAYSNDSVELPQKKQVTPSGNHHNEDAETVAGIQYNYKGQKANTTELNENGSIRRRTYYSYNANNEFMSKYTKVYDTNGNLIREMTCDKDSSMTTETYYRYEQIDANGNWHKQIRWTVDDSLEFLFPKLYITQREITYY